MSHTHPNPTTNGHSQGGLSFVDGHAEIKRWLDPRTITPVPPFGPCPNSQDIVWLQLRATSKR
jgi:hypothetical protein